MQTDPADAARPLAVFHRPSIGSRESSDMADRAIHDTLSMERLLVHTVYIRSLARLADIKAEFQKFLLNDSDCANNISVLKFSQTNFSLPDQSPSKERPPFSPCQFSNHVFPPISCTSPSTLTPERCAATYPSTATVQFWPNCRRP